VVIRDKQDNEYNGTFIDWSITLWGEAVDAEKAKLHPLPGEESKTLVHHPQPTHTASAIITSLSSTSSSIIHATGNPSNHIDRPVNVKPTSSVEQGTIEGLRLSRPA
jgi:kexin